MTVIRLIYLAVVLIAGLFVVMYVDSLSLLLLLVVLALPLILLLLLTAARVFTKITVDLPQTVSTRGQAVSVKFNLRNYSIIALPKVRATVFYKGAFSDVEEKTEISFPLYALTKQIAFCDINSDHVGVVKVEIRDIFLQDYFSLFKFKIKIRKSFEVSFLPEISPVSMDLRPNTLLGADSDVFSKSKKGDDPSEVFAIREYVGGDKLNRIHWKLSSKQEELMVKDYSLPINNNIVIVADMASKKSEDALDDIDAVVEGVVCLSNFLCEAEIIHHICWYDVKGDRLFNEEIRNMDDMYTALGMMLSSGIGNSADSMAYWKEENIICSHLAYVTAVPSAEAIKDLEEISFSTYYSIMTVGDSEALANASSGMQFIGLERGKVAKNLAGFTL